MGKAEPLDPGSLLAQASWVRRLAGRLLVDPAAADDIAQEALTAALRGKPRDARNLRGWLAGIVRNLVRARHRSQASREERERDARVPGLSPSPEDVLERGENFRLVVESVFQLDEPYRSTVLLRYFDGLSTPEIAERTGASTGAIRTRLSRGLAKLREELDRRHGGDASDWLAAVAGLPLGALPPLTGAPLENVGEPAVPPAASGSIPRPSLPVLATGGVALVSTKAVLATVLVVPALVIGGLWLRSEREAPQPATPLERSSTEVAAAAPALEPTDPGPGTTTTRIEVATEPEEEKPFVHPPVPGYIQNRPSTPIGGRVVDLNEAPVGGIRVEMYSGDMYPGQTARDEIDSGTETAHDGTFELENNGTYGTLVANDEQYAPVYNAMYNGMGGGISRNTETTPLTLVVGPRGHFEGEVVDIAGRPIPGVDIEIELPLDLRTRFSAVLANCTEERRSTTTDADGRFTIEAACVPESRLLFAKTGYAAEEIDLPASSTFDLRIVLGDLDRSMLLGRVVNERGMPVEGAQLAFGWSSADSDQDGRFQFEVKDDGDWGGWEPEEVLAIYPGYLPARVSRDSMPNREWGGSVTLTLAEPAKSIRGKVVRADGKPVSGATIHLVNPTFFGAARLGNSDTYSTADIEQLLNDEGAGHNRSIATTTSDGHFEARGLLAQEYQLLVIEPEQLLRTVTEPILAPTDGVVIQLDEPELVRVAGRIVDSNGDPIPGTTVTMNIVRQVDRQGLPFGGGYPEYFGTMYTAYAGANGGFSFPEINPAEVRLQIYKHPLVSVFHVDLAEVGQPLDDLEIVAYRRCHFFVELADSQLATSFQLLDERGEPVSIVRGRGNMTTHMEEGRIREGRSETVSASERACTLVLLKDGEPIERLPVELSPDEVRRIGL